MEGIVKVVKEVVSEDKSLIDKATTVDDYSMPQGYVLQQIVENSFESAERTQQILDILLRKMTVPSPRVKLKTLRIIKHLLQRGHPTLHSLFQQNSDIFREALIFTGPSDPLRGDVPYVEVRNEAKEVMQLLFNKEREESKQVVVVGVSSQSAASNTSIGTSTPPRSTSNRISTPSKESPASLLAALLPSTGNQLSNFGSPNSLVDSPEQTHQLTAQSGGGWFEDKELNSVHSPLIDDTHSVEQQMVYEITESSGRTGPSRSALSEFCKRVQHNSVNVPLVCELLSKQLKSDTWHVRLKALYTIEAMMHSQIKESIEYFANNSATVVEQTRDVNKSIQDKATKILQIVAPQALSKPTSVQYPAVPSIPDPFAAATPQLVSTENTLTENTLTENTLTENTKSDQTLASQTQDSNWILAENKSADSNAISTPQAKNNSVHVLMEGLQAASLSTATITTSTSNNSKEEKQTQATAAPWTLDDLKQTPDPFAFVPTVISSTRKK